MQRFITIAALTLALCLIAGPAWAVIYGLTNSSGGAVEARCSENSSYSNISNGTTTNFTCTGSLAVRVAGSTSLPYLVPFQCNAGQGQTVTATAGSSTGTLSFSVSCASR